MTATAEEILKLYDDALADINTEIQKIKYNFAKRYGIDNDKAAFFLTQAQEEENLKMLVKALENAPDDKAREDILEYIHRDGLSVRAYASRIERYEAVKTSIYARIKKLAVDETAMLGGMLKEAYKESYYGNIDDIAKGFDVGINFGILNDDAINEAVNAKWSGKRFSQRIWDNTDRLAKEAQNLIVKSLMSGESNTKTAQKLADRMQVEKFHATTLVRTETAHIHTMADLKAYEDLGIEQYKYLATLDYKTCQTCSPLDGQVFYRRDAREGRNCPVMHPRCRCTTTMAMEFDKRRARNPLTGKNELIDGNITYSQWIENMTPQQKQALELARRKDSNRTADKLQHEKYKKLLGTKEVPKSFGDFQKMKYAEPDKWKELKRLYRENSIDKTVKSDIIDIEIDEFVPCLKKAKTGEILSTEVSTIKRSELYKYNSRNGWNDEWKNRPINEEVFGVFIKEENEPQGLISLRYDVGGVYIASVSTAPQNNKAIVGEKQEYLGVGGHLFALAVEQSVKKGGNGTVYGYASNAKVLKHYIDKFGAKHIPIVHEYQFLIEGEASQRLLDIYNYERRG